MRGAQEKTSPCSLWRRQVVPSGQSGLSAMFASRRPFFRSRIHQSFRPYRSTSAAHILQIRWRGTSRPGSGPGCTLWTSTNRSSSISGANPRGCDNMCSTIYKCLVRQTTYFRAQKRQINLAIYVPRRNVLGTEIVEHDLYLKGVSVEALVHLGGLNEVADVRHPMGMSACETDGNATVLHADSAEEYLTHVALCRRGCIDCEQIFAVRPDPDLAS